MNLPRIECIIHIDGDVWYEEKIPQNNHNDNRKKESKSIKRDKRILRLDRLPMERIKPVCDRKKCYENCLRRRSQNKKKETQNRKHRDKKLKNKYNKNIIKKTKAVTTKKKSVSNKINRKKHIKKTKCKKKKPAGLKIKPNHNTSCNTTSTNTTNLEGLSPISCEESLEFSYENISSDSLSGDEVGFRVKENERNQKPSQSKGRRTNFSEPLSPEIENYYQPSSPYFHTASELLRANTPSYAEDNVTLFSSEMDVSIHSLPTVVMSPSLDSSVYSPNISSSELIFRSEEILFREETPYKCDVKTEPYSERNKDNDWYYNMSCELEADLKTTMIKTLKVKKEIDEPEKYNDNVKVNESVKTEPSFRGYVYSPTIDF